MSYQHDEHDDYDQPRERELTLSTGTILGIFFGLALLCGVFFAFGYNLGAKAHQSPTGETETAASSSSTNFNSFKPAPGAPASQPLPSSPAPQEVVVTTKPAAATPVASAPSKPLPEAPEHAPAASPSREPTVVAPAPTPAKPAAPAPHSATDVTGTFLVQVAAVSHQEDADLLMNALKRKGYTVMARTEPQDKLIRVQIGPFTSKKDAEAMAQRLMADGYNAYLK